MSKIFQRIAAIVSTTAIIAASTSVSASADKFAEFNDVRLGNYIMSGSLDGSCYGGYAWTRCNQKIYFIGASVEGYYVGDDGTIYDLKKRSDERNNSDKAYAFVGGQSPLGLRTGSFWSCHEIRTAEDGIARYLATIDV